MQRFVGPHRVVKAFPEKSLYELDIDPARRIFRYFHADKLRPYLSNNSNVDAQSPVDSPPRPRVTFRDMSPYIQDIIGHRFKHKQLEFKIHWIDQPRRHATYIGPESISNLSHIHNY